METIKKGTVISKNFQIEKCVNNVNQIEEQSLLGKSLYVRTWNRLTPATVILSMQTRLVLRMINSKIIYIVKRIEK